jgi:hypothetical protein
MSEPLCLSIWKASGTLHSLIARHHHDISIDAHQGASPASRRNNDDLCFYRHRCINLPESKSCSYRVAMRRMATGLLCPSCSGPFRGVLPWAPRACSKRVLLAVPSSCGVVLLLIPCGSPTPRHYVWNLTRTGHHLTQGPFRTRSLHWVKSSSATEPVVAQRNSHPLSFFKRIAQHSHRSVGG